jgi:pimeloyl-ACP methyl ester carboxylesterase
VRRVVCVHGIGQQHKGEDVLRADWAPALRDGIRQAGKDLLGDTLADGEICVAFYGDLFRPPGRPLGVGDPWLTPEDMTGVERELLMTWWQGAAASDGGVISPDAQTLTPRSVQAALRALSNSRFFAGIAERGLLLDLRQVSRYLSDPAVRQDAQDRVTAAVGEDEVRVLIGHSLGSVVAYEALCAHPEWPVRALVTLGSPLGIRNLIFDRLQPPGGCWPGPVRAWTNVADAGDVVALVKDLRPQFGPEVECYLVDNGSHAHAVSPYLTARETGAAIADALAEDA